MRTVLAVIRSLIFASLFVAVWGWLALRVRVYDSRFGFALPGWVVVAGVALMVLGGAVVLACLAAFSLRGKGTPAPFDPPRNFVAVGPYRYVRNPMYAAGALVLAGFGLYLLSFSILLLAVLMLLLAHLFVVFYEEPSLRNRFGADYEEYCRRVPRWPGATPGLRGN